MNFNKFHLPPLNLEATNLADECKHWMDTFENYRIATKLNKEEDVVQRATFSRDWSAKIVNQKEHFLQEYADAFKEELEVFKNYEYDIKVNKEVKR